MKRFPFARNLAVYGIFAASGASALIYQVIWSRWLGLSFGSTTVSVSIVLGCFMTGLALGSFVAGRNLSKVRDPMRAYAAVEAGIGVFALAFPLLYGGADRLYALLIRPDSPAVITLSARAALSFLLLMVPTTLMGATLPLLTEHFRRNPRRTAGFKVGILYAANTLGAALGIFAGSFVLIELVGVFMTTALAASLNFLVAAAGYLFSRGASSGRLPESATDPDSPSKGGDETGAGGRNLSKTGKMAIVVLAAGGGAALASEILWTRTLETLVGNSTYAFATIVISYLVGIALGSGLMALVLRRLRTDHVLWLAGLQLAMGAWMLASIFLFRKVAARIAANSEQILPLSLIFLAFLKAILILMPLALLSGAAFPLAARMIEPDSEDPKGESVARAYSWNTAGAVAGSLLAGFVVAPRFDFLDSLYLLAFVYGLIAVAMLSVLAWWNREMRRGERFILTAAAAAVVVIALAARGMTAESIYPKLIRAAFPGSVVTFHKSGLQGVVTAFKWGLPDGSMEGLYDGLLVNGRGMTAKVTDTKMMAHLPLLVHPDPKDTLVICFGMGTTYRSAISHGGNVAVVELVEEVLEAFPWFYPDAGRVRSYPKGRIIVNDGRNFLRLTREKFDVITIDPPPPIDAAGVVNLYSKEFLELAKSRLKRGGIMAHWYPFPGRHGGVDDWGTFNALTGTFGEVFPYVYANRGFAGVGAHLLGSMEPIPPYWPTLLRRYDLDPVRSDIREWDDVPLDYLAAMKPVRLESAGKRTLTDDRPFLEFYLIQTLMGGGKKEFPRSFWGLQED